MWCRAPGGPSASSSFISSRKSALAVPEADGRLHLYSQGQGIFDDRLQVAAVLGIPEEKLFVELVPNGGAFGGKRGHDHPGADRAAGAHHAAAGAHHAQPRRIDPHAPQAASDHHDLYGRLRRRRPADGGESLAARRFRRLCLGRRQGAGARRRARLRALPRARRRDRIDRRLHQQSALRRHARLRRQPDQLRHRGLHRPARRQGRHRRLGDALAQRVAHGRRVHHRPGAGEGRRRRRDPAGGEGRLLCRARARARGRHRLRREELRPRQRRHRVRQVPSRGRGRRQRRALHRLHRDGAGPAHRADPMRGGGERPAGERVPAAGSIRASSSAPGRPPARAPRCLAGRAAAEAAAKLKADLDRGLALADLVGPHLRGRGQDRRHHRARRQPETA